jgi:hypothetical protein
MCYGPDPGDSRLRKNIASWLTSFYQQRDPVSEERICITGGASQNLACLLQVYTDPVYTRNVWVVAPAYMLSFRMFEDAGFHTKLRAIPEDHEGIDIEYLQRELKKSEDKAEADGNNEPVSNHAVYSTALGPRHCNTKMFVATDHTRVYLCTKKFRSFSLLRICVYIHKPVSFNMLSNHPEVQIHKFSTVG